MLALIAAACLALCIYGALSDIATLTIPNWVNGAIAGLGACALIVSGIGLEAAGWHLLVAVIALVVSFALFAFGVFGGGDAKMIPALALWMGPDGIVPFLFYMAVIGGAIALVGVAARYAPLPAGLPNWVYNTLSKGEGVPYGVAIAGGALLTVPNSPLLGAALQTTGFVY